MLHNLTVIEAEGLRSQVTRVPDASVLPELVEERFRVPRAITREAMTGLPLAQDPWD